MSISALFLSIAAAVAVPGDADTVVCLKNNAGEDLWVLLGERYTNGSRDARKIRLGEGRTSCIKYQDNKSVDVQHYFIRETDRMQTARVYRSRVCDQVEGGAVVTYALGAEPNGRKTCAPDHSMSVGDLRALTAEVNAFGID
jgi:hypothetical protein